LSLALIEGGLSRLRLGGPGVRPHLPPWTVPMSITSRSGAKPSRTAAVISRARCDLFIAIPSAATGRHAWLYHRHSSLPRRGGRGVGPPAAGLASGSSRTRAADGGDRRARRVHTAACP
jgi:hypothetical protein